MTGRTPEEIRASVQATREDLEYSLRDLEGKVSEITNWRAQIANHRREILIGAAVTGFVLGGGIAAIAGIFRR